jgi:hypothetical protein
MYWRGIVIRCGEHAEQTTLPHFLQKRQYGKQIILLADKHKHLSR